VDGVKERRNMKKCGRLGVLEGEEEAGEMSL